MIAAGAACQRNYRLAATSVDSKRREVPVENDSNRVEAYMVANCRAGIARG